MSMAVAGRIAIDPHLALVIDDDAKLRQFIETTLMQLGMKVAAFEIAKDALRSLDDGHPAVIFLGVALLRSDAITSCAALASVSTAAPSN
jgi:DNA-binding NtrC family response regulator